MVEFLFQAFCCPFYLRIENCVFLTYVCITYVCINYVYRDKR